MSDMPQLVDDVIKSRLTNSGVLAGLNDRLKHIGHCVRARIAPPAPQ